MSCEELGVSRSRAVFANEVRGDDAEDATVKTLTVAASESVVLRPGAAPGSVVDVDGDAIVRGTLKVRGDDEEAATVKTLTLTAPESVVLRPGATPHAADVDGDAIVRGGLSVGAAFEISSNIVSGDRPDSATNERARGEMSTYPSGPSPRGRFT
eukprot:jgi/Mesvir1/28367/Mv11630-RA.1